MDASQLVKPMSLAPEGVGPASSTSMGVIPLTLDARPVAEAVLEILTRSVAVSTNKTYFKAWNERRTSCKVRMESPVMASDHTPDSRFDEERLLQFSVFLADTLSRAAGTVKNKLMGSATSTLSMDSATRWWGRTEFGSCSGR